MYKAFYGLSGEPFVKSIKAKDLFKSTNFKESISRLDYMKNKRGLMLLTGEPGIGKSTLIRAFIDSLSEISYKVVYLPLSTVNRSDFYRQLNEGLGGERQHRKTDLFKSIQKLIVDYHKNRNMIPVIIFDEAQYLDTESLYELQMLLNFHIDSYDPALFILAGQQHLREKLSRQTFASIEQRIVIKAGVVPLNEEETGKYIEHQLELKGRKEKLFNDNATLAIYKKANGVMRVINNICLKALMYGVSQKIETIDEEVIYQSIREL